MPRKGIKGLWLSFSPKPPTSPSFDESPSRFGFSPARPSFGESVMDRMLELAEPVIAKWNPETTTFGSVTSLFYHNRREAWDFIKTVKNLHKAMHMLAEEKSTSKNLARGQNLMQIAMKRLQKEFYQILSINRAHLDPESVSARSSRTSIGSSVSGFDDDEDEIRAAVDLISEVEDVSTLAMADLRLIADCMISSGYAKECFDVYKLIRKSIVDEGIYKLGVEKFISSQIHKMDWEALDVRIKSWLNAVSTAVKTLFNGERILCDHVFASSDSIRDSCFTEITKQGALILFGFPEIVAKYSRKSPVKIFRLLDMYAGIANNWQDIDSIFSFASTDSIKSQAANSLIKLTESIRSALDDFESTLLKDSSKHPIAGSGIHPLTVNSMNYLTLLADYSNILSDIFADSTPPAKNLLPESYFGFSESDDSPAPAISLKLAWLTLVLLCKLDAKAKYYKDVSLAYLFLANNLQYVVVEVQTSNLRYLLGNDWLTKHESKIKQFASNYERLGWGHVIETLPSDGSAADTPEKVKDTFRRFTSAFDQAHRKQAACVVPDSKLRDYIKVSIARKIFRLYRAFYNAHRNSVSNVKYAPEDVGHRLSDLFFGDVESGSFSSFPPSSSPSPSRTPRSR